MALMTDAAAESELIARARKRDLAAFEELHARHKDEVFSVTLALLRDRSLAEDAHQEAFLRIFASLDRFDPERAFRPWVVQVARNAAIDLARARRKGERLVEEKLGRTESAPADPVPAEVTQREDRDRTREALDALPLETRALLLERHALGLTLGELAESWGVAERTITTRLQEASALLASALKRGGVR